MKTAVVFCSILMCPMPAGACRVNTNWANLRLLQTAVRQFRMDSGRLPTAREGLNALAVPPDDVRNWPVGGYLETTDVPEDGWGHDFVYVPDPNLPHGFGIYSCGQDGVSVSHGNDCDDINTWDTRPSPNAYHTVPTTREVMAGRAGSLAIVLLILAAVVLILGKGFGAGRKPAS